jgi:hypothetical protein
MRDGLTDAMERSPDSLRVKTFSARVTVQARRLRNASMRDRRVIPSDPCVTVWQTRFLRTRRLSSTAFPVHVDYPHQQ